MRTSVILLACSLLGVVGGAWLIGRWAVGLAVIADSVAVGVFAWQRDDGAGPLAEPQIPALEQVLDRSRRSA